MAGARPKRIVVEEREACGECENPTVDFDGSTELAERRLEQIRNRSEPELNSPGAPLWWISHVTAAAIARPSTEAIAESVRFSTRACRDEAQAPGAERTAQRHLGLAG